MTFCPGVYIYRCGDQKGASPNLLLNQIWAEAILTDTQHCSVDYAEDIHQGGILRQGGTFFVPATRKERPFVCCHFVIFVSIFAFSASKECFERLFT